MNDRYTKAVLTVIAVCLVYQVGKELVSPAVAQGRVQEVNIVGVGGNGFSFGAVNSLSPALPVKVVQ